MLRYELLYCGVVTHQMIDIHLLCFPWGFYWKLEKCKDTLNLNRVDRGPGQTK